MNDKNLTLPPYLKPRDGRFGSGPSKIRNEQLSSLTEFSPHIIGTSHRQAPVKNLVKQIQEGLSELFKLPNGYEVILGNGGATSFWDAAAAGLISQQSSHGSYGEFSNKFYEVSKNTPWLEEPTILKAEVGQGINPQDFTPQIINKADTIAWAHNETSTGVSIPVIRHIAEQEALVCIDGTSAAGGVAVDMNQCDVYYFSAQKAFSADGGLWFALINEKAVERIEHIASESPAHRWIPESLSLQLALENSRKNQTYNTPALLTLILIHQQIQWILSQGGLHWSDQRTRTSSSLIYNWAEKSDFCSPFVRDPAYRSQTITTIDFNDNVNAETLAKVLRHNGIVDTEPYRKLGRNQLRIATFPSIEPTDIEALINCIDYIVTNT